MNVRGVRAYKLQQRPGVRRVNCVAVVSEESRYYGTGEAAKVIGVSRQRVAQLLQSGQLAGERDPQTGRWRIAEHELRDYVRSREMRAPDGGLEAVMRLRELEVEVRHLLERVRAAEEEIRALRDLGHQHGDAILSEMRQMRDQLDTITRVLSAS